MATEITTTSVVSIVNPEEISADFLEAVRANMVMVPLVKQGKIPKGTKTISIPRRFASTSFTSRTNDATEFARVDWVPTDVTATPTTVGRTASISDEAARASIFPLGPAIAHDTGADLANKIDVDLAALIDGFSNEIGTTGQPPSVDDLMLAIYTIGNAKGNKGPLAFVGHNVFWLHVMQALGASAFTSTVYSQSNLYQFLSPSAPGTGYKGMILGCAAFETTNTKSINSSADYANGLMAVGDNCPIMLAWAEREDGSLWMPTAEAQRHPEFAALDVTMTACYAAFENGADERGVQITATQTA
jgi:hypothetical protein